MGKLISLSVWLNRKAPYGERTTESEAAATRCWVKFKIAHKRAMDERDGLVKPDTRTPRPWPPSVSKSEQIEQGTTPPDPSP